MTVNPVKIVQSFFPKLTNKEAQDWAWQFTAFPFFKTDDPETEMRQQLTIVKATMEAGHKPCDFCGEPSIKGRFLCKRHEAEWKQIRKDIAQSKFVEYAEENEDGSCSCGECSCEN